MNIEYSKLPRDDVFIVDMKSFYSSVECFVALDPLETYLAVVGDVDRSGSVVLAASPKMKNEFQIKTGSRRYEIPDDPRIQVVSARMGLYLDFLMSITRVLNEFVPAETIHVYSVDESWIIGNGMRYWYGSAWELARKPSSNVSKRSLNSHVLSVLVLTNLYRYPGCSRGKKTGLRPVRTRRFRQSCGQCRSRTFGA